jgi:RNA polymerase sigma factor for flagellar operon FliA
VSRSSAQPTPEQLAILDQVLRQVVRAARLPFADAEDFCQGVHVRLLERGYDVFRRFDGRSSFRTYLTAVVRRLLLDWNNAVRGKWRPSAAATRLGALAVALERLVHRDAYQVGEAIQVLRSRGCAESTSALHALWDRLPKRERRQLISDQQLAEQHGHFVDPLDAAQRQRARARMTAALCRMLRDLPPEDRRLLRARYRDTQSVQAVAQTLQVDPKVLYRRFDRVLRSLRRSLEEAGLTGSQIH